MKITAILPIFNEEKTVADIISVLTSSSRIDEIVVVDDASTDNSLEIIKKFQSEKLNIFHFDKNLGKSGAVKYAVSKVKTDILFFCDGDLHGFGEKHIDRILKHFYSEKELMVVGIMDRGFIHNKFVKKFGPLISGERAISYKLFNKILSDDVVVRMFNGYAMEILLNDYCVRNNIIIKKEILVGVRQTLKPKKNKNGFWLLIKESIELSLVYIKIKIYGIKK